MPELCGSTSESIAWTAMAASTALPPRFSTSYPACAASGFAAMTKASSFAAETGWVCGCGCGCGAGTVAQADRPTAAQAASIL